MHEDIEGWLVASDEANGIMVALDTEMTEELEMQVVAFRGRVDLVKFYTPKVF